jgi:hypothetical protein
MEDELQAARERRLKREIDQLVADFRRGFQWPQGPMSEVVPGPQVFEPRQCHLKLMPDGLSSESDT